MLSIGQTDAQLSLSSSLSFRPSPGVFKKHHERISETSPLTFIKSNFRIQMNIDWSHLRPQLFHCAVVANFIKCPPKTIECVSEILGDGSCDFHVFILKRVDKVEFPRMEVKRDWFLSYVHQTSHQIFLLFGTILAVTCQVTKHLRAKYPKLESSRFQHKQSSIGEFSPSTDTLPAGLPLKKVMTQFCTRIHVWSRRLRTWIL